MKLNKIVDVILIFARKIIVNWFQLKAFIKYKRTAKYKKGHRIHPPFAFDLVRHVFYDTHPFYHFVEINEIRQELLKSNEKIEVNDLGSGSKKFRTNIRKVKDLVKYNATPQRQGELISRLITEFKPKNIIELGTSLGLGTLYLAKPDSKAKVYSIEGCPNVSTQAKKTFALAKVNNVQQQVGSFEDELPKVLGQLENVDMVYFDGHHDYDATLNYFEMCLKKASESALFIFDDIHWSEGMESAWNEIVKRDRVSISFDLFRFGIAIIDKDVMKQHYIVKWP